MEILALLNTYNRKTKIIWQIILYFNRLNVQHLKAISTHTNHGRSGWSKALRTRNVIGATLALPPEDNKIHKFKKYALFSLRIHSFNEQNIVA